MKSFFDTETTGLINFKVPIDHPSQPRLVQLAVIFTDDEGKEMSTIDLIIKPNGFDIPQTASNIHGITTEKALQCGVPIITALTILNDILINSDQLIAHNVQYDELIIKRESLLAGLPIEIISNIQKFCTMKQTMGICKIPSTYGGYKYPKLQESYKHAFGEEFQNAHNAFADISATKKLYFWLKEKNKEVV